MKKTILILSSSIVFILIFLMFLIAGTSIIGLKPYRHANGSIMYITETSNIDIKVNDIIFFNIGIGEKEKTATGPVRDISYGKNYFYIYAGDISYADNGIKIIEDPMQLVPIEFDCVRGKVAFSLPLLGYLSEFLTSKTGFAIVLIITVLFSLLIAFSSFMPSDDKKKHKRRSRYRMQIPSKEEVTYEIISDDEELLILKEKEEASNAPEEKADDK